MGRSLVSIALAAVVLTAAPQAQSDPARDRFWFCPGPGTLDYIRLFEHPEEWAHARQLMSVFKFYQQHTRMPPAVNVGPNNYDALARAGAFRLLAQWGKKIALEAGSVKEFYCTADESGMNASIADTVGSLRAVAAAGGSVSYIAMDDPFAAGKAPICGGPALEPTVDRIAIYVKGVKAQFPNVQIGLIDAYPSTSEPDLETAIDMLRARGASPAFVHADVDSRGLRPGRDDFTRDMRALRDACRNRGIPFGIIAWGYNGDADALYARDVGFMAKEINLAFPQWSELPEHLIVQSWAVSQMGLSITPSNLPEDEPYTHTNILWMLYRQFRGQIGPSTGAAVPRGK